MLMLAQYCMKMSNEKSRNGIELERGKRLRFVRTIAGMTVKVFARQCGVGLTTVNYWENGVNRLTERGAQKVVRAMQDEGIACTTLWLLQGIGELPRISDQTKLSRLNYNSVVLPTLRFAVHEEPHIYSETHLREEMKLFKNLHTSHLVCAIRDYDMSPVYQPGDWVGGPTLSSEVFELAHGKNCIVQFKEGNVLVRRVRVEGVQANKLSFYVINAEYSLKYPPIYQVSTEVVTALAPVMRVWREQVATV